MRPDRRAFSSRVARRTFVLFVSCALLPVSALAVLALRQVTSELYEQHQRRMHQESKTVAMGLLGHLQAAEAAMTTTAVQADRPGGDEIERPVTGVLLVTGDGSSRLLSGAMDRPPTLTPQQRGRVAAGRTVLSTEHDPGGRVRFLLSRALDPARPDRGILHGTVNPGQLWTVKDEAGLQPGVRLTILDDSGRLLFSSSTSTRPLPESVAQRARERTAGHFEWSDDSGEYIATYWSLFLQSAFSTSKWTIVLHHPKADVLAPIVRFKLTFLLVIVLTVLMVLLLSVRQIRKSLTPLGRLQEGTRRLAAGDLDARVEVASRDEFQELAGSFNRMADQLGRQFTALDMRRELGAALNSTQAMDDVLQAGAAVLARHLGLAALGVWVAGGDDTALELRATVESLHGPDGKPGTLLSESELQRLARERQPYVSAAPGADHRLSDLEWVVREGIGTFVGHPLVVEDRLVGVVAAFARRPLHEADLNGLAAAAGDIAGYIDRKRVEDALLESESQLRQLQKMEAVGRLAGGIAHDFNNLLTVILGRSRLLLEAMPADHPHQRSVRSIDETAERAALLTRQLLAFSRKQLVVPESLDLNEVVVGMTDLLQRLIGESVELVVAEGADVGQVKADRGQLEQVIVNLVVNARDAMPEGGRITIETSAGGAGRQAILTVTDTGTGMDAHTRARVFEPFFTTKEPGKGTGLGLATVYGIVQQSGGRIQVDSELGVGTTFTISLPRVEEGAETVAAPSAPPGRGTETVLLVEDEAEVRALVHAVLAEHGYLVLSAGRPGEALHLAERHPGPIHLLVSDMVMPEMGGPALARRLITLRPEMAVLYLSGYTDAAVGEGSLFLQKPFTPDVVLRTVRAALDAVSPTAVASAP